MTIPLNKQLIRQILFVGLLSCVSCSKKEGKTETSSAAIALPILDLTSIPSTQDVVVPDYLMNQTVFFLSAENAKFTRFDVRIKSLALIDFNGNVEPIVTYKQPLWVNLAGLAIERLLLVDSKVFAADYERLLITLDTKDMHIETLQKGVLRREKLMHFIGLQFTGKDLTIEVGINQDQGVFLTSDSMKQLTIQIDLDKSVKTILDGSRSANLFRPSVSVSSSQQWPERFTLLSQGLQVDYQDETISLNTKQSSIDKQYYLNTVPAGGVSPLFYKGAGGHAFEDTDGAPNIYSLALIDRVSEGGILLRSLWMSDDPISLTVNDKPDSMGFHSQSGSVDAAVDFNHIMPLLPEFTTGEISDKLALGQQGFLIKTLDKPQVVLAPLPITAKFIEEVSGGETGVWKTEKVNERYFYSQSSLPSPIFVKVTDEVAIVQPEKQHDFLSYLMEGSAWQFIAHQILSNTTEVITFEQSEFASTSLVANARFVGDQLMLAINTQHVTDWPANLPQEHTVIFNDRTQRVKLTRLSNLGIATKVLSDYRDLYDILQLNNASPIPVHTMKLSADKNTGDIVAAEIVIYHFPEIYAALASSEDALPIGNGLSSTQKNQLMDKQILIWAEVLANKSALEEEKLCSSDDGVDIKLISYCRHKKVIAGKSEIIGDIVDRFMFSVSRNVFSVRHAYHQVQAGLTHTEANLLALHIQGHQGYSPNTIAQSTNLQRTKKIMDNFNFVYQAVGELFPRFTLKKAVDTLDKQLTKKPSGDRILTAPKKVRARTP